MRIHKARVALLLVTIYVVVGYGWLWYAASVAYEAHNNAASVKLERNRLADRMSECNQVTAEEEGRIRALQFEEEQLVGQAEGALTEVNEKEKFCMWQTRKAVETAQSAERELRTQTSKLYEGEGVAKALLLEGLATLLGLPEKSVGSMDLSLTLLRTHLVNELAGRLAAPREKIGALSNEALLKQVTALMGT